MIWPHNTEAEKIVISTCFAFPESAPEIIDCVSPEDFYDPRHTAIMQAVEKVLKDKLPLDAAMIADHIDKKFADAVIYLSTLLDVSPNSQCQPHIKTILEDSALRRGIKTCEAAKEKLSKANGNAMDIIDEVQTEILGLTVRGNSTTFINSYDAMQKAVDRIREMQNGKDFGIKTGFFKLDQASGGLRGSQFIIIAGRPGQGKTAFALSMIYNMCLYDHKCGLFSLEMDNDAISNRRIAIMSGINSLRLSQDQHIPAGDMSAILEAAQKNSKWPLIVDDQGGLTVSEIKRRARLMRKQGVEIIFIDQLSKILARGKDRFEQRANAVNDLSPLAKELRIPIVLLAQINREAEKNKASDRWSNKPATWMLKDTGTLEEDADMILLVYRPYQYTRDEADKTFANIEISKQRNGPAPIDIELEWVGKRMLFKDKEE